MRKRLYSLSVVLFFNLVSLSLIASVVLYRTDFIFAQSNAEEEVSPALVPRSSSIANDNDEDDDDRDGDDPPTDNDGTDSDGYDTPLPTTDNDGFDTPPPPTDNDGTDSDGYTHRHRPIMMAPTAMATIRRCQQPTTMALTRHR